MQEGGKKRSVGNVLFVDCAPFNGGAQRSLLTLLNGIREGGCDPFLLSADHTPGGLLESCCAAGIPCRPFHAAHWQRSVRGLFRFIADRRAFRPIWADVCRTVAPTLVHANTARSGLLLRGIAGVDLPIILHARDLRTPRTVRRLVAPRVSCIVAVSKCVAEPWLRPAGRPGKVRVVYNGLEIEIIARTPPTEVAVWPKDRLIAILVADIVPWKRHELFLQAVRTAQLTIPELRAIIVGRALDDAGQRRLHELRCYAEALGLDQTVRFIDDAGNAVPWIAAADLLVSTSEAEPFGRTLVEALALGKPVVACKGCGPGEILAGCDAGTLVEPTAQAIAAGIGTWREPESRRQIAAAARARAEEFSTERMLRAMRTVFDEFASR